MIAADSSTWVAFIEGDTGKDVETLERGLTDQHILLPPAVLSELCSDPQLPASIEKVLLGLPLIEVESGYWQRAGVLRAKLLAKGRRARLGDALIAQSCIDRGIALLTRDRGFQAFADAAGLNLLI